MHEFSIGQWLVAALVDELQKLNTQYSSHHRLLRATVAIGRLRQVVTDYLLSAYQLLIPGTLAEGSELTIRIIPLQMKCCQCGWQGEISFPVFSCPSCNSGQLDTYSGMELYLENIEVETPNETVD